MAVHKLVLEDFQGAAHVLYFLLEIFNLTSNDGVCSKSASLTGLRLSSMSHVGYSGSVSRAAMATDWHSSGKFA
eukprot:3619138-Amphidinium_carterae.1